MAVLLLVVLATRPQAASPTPSAGASAPAGIVGSPSAAPLGTPTRTPHVTVAQLHGIVNGGTADGQLFEITSTLEESSNIFCAQDPCAKQYELLLVGGVITDERNGLFVKPARPSDGSTPIDGTFVVTPWKGSLVLLGQLQGSLDQPVDPRTLTPKYVDQGTGVIAIAPVSGRLTYVPAECPTVLPGATGCGNSQSVLLAFVGSGASADPLPVSQTEPTLGVDLATANSVDGPFLVRTGEGSRLTLIARYDQAAVTIVDAPTVTCDVAAGSSLPSCRQLLRLTIDESAVQYGDVQSVEIHQGAWTCPAGAMCSSVPPEQRAYAVVHASSGVWTIGMAFDTTRAPIDIVPILVASSYGPSTTIVPAYNTCAEQGYGQNGVLECKAALAAAMGVIPPGTDVVSLHFAYGLGCPPGYFCFAIPPTPDPNTGHVIVHVASPGPDLWVNVRADASGTVTADQPMSFPVASPSASEAP
jgi:hypothetical protein